MNKYFNKIDNTKKKLSWKNKGLSGEVIKSPTINNNSLATKLEYMNKKIFVKFNGSCLVKQNKSTFNRKIVNIYIVYDLDSNINDFDSIFKNCLFGAIKITCRVVMELDSVQTVFILIQVVVSVTMQSFLV